MTNEELVGLIQKGENVSENMGLLYGQNKKAIYCIAKPYSAWVDIDDLMQEAYFGLYEAAMKCDLSLDFKFMTYASYSIKKQFQKYLESAKSYKRIPRSIENRILKYYKFRHEYVIKYGIEPSEDTIMDGLHIKKKETLDNLLRIIREELTFKSLDEAISSDDDKLSLMDLVADSKSSHMEDDIVDRLTRKQLNQELWEQVELLEERPRGIIFDYFHDGKSMQDICKGLQISKARANEIKQKALAQLREMNKVQKIAEAFDYYCSAAYHGSLQRFKDTGESNVEYLALKHIEQVEKEREATDLFNQILQMV